MKMYAMSGDGASSFRTKPVRLRGIRLAVGSLFLMSTTALGQGTSGGKDILALDLDSLLNMEVTTASKFAEKLSDAPGVMSVVSKDELRRFGGNTLGEILGRVPGLTTTSSYFTDRSMVAARGDQTKIDAGHVLILINGRPVREIWEGGVSSDLLEAFPVGILERIEVIKGPGSVLYGSNAFSAVVNLITQKADRSTFEMRALQGEGGALGTSGRAMLNHRGLNIVAAAQMLQPPDWTTTYRLPINLIGDPFAAGAPAAQSVRIRERGKGAYLEVDYKGLRLMSALTQWNSASFVRGIAGTTRWNRGFGNLGYDYKASDKWNMSFDLTYTRNTLAASYNPNIHRDSNEFVLEWTNFIHLSKNDQLTVGALYNYRQGQEDYLGVVPTFVIGRGGAAGGASYAQLDHKLRPNLKLIGGVQANKIDKIALDVVPRAGFIWNPAARFTVKTLFSKAFRAPALFETRLNHPALVGNPNLVPEEVSTVDVSVGYQGSRIQLGVNTFYSKLADSIVISTASARWTFVNSGKTTFHGAEFEGKYFLRKNFFFEGSMLYQANHDAAGHKNITPIPNVEVKGGISYEVKNRFAASIFDVHQGSVDGFSSTVNPPARPYHLINADLRVDLAKLMPADSKTGMSLFAHAENLTNREVWRPDLGGNSGDTIPLRRGRTIYFGIDFSLNKE